MASHRIERDGVCIGEFQLTPLPGNSKICISHGLQIFEEYRGKGYATKANQERVELARSLGFKIMLASVRTDNLKQGHILRKTGWRSVSYYHNDGYNVTLWIRHLDDPYEKADFFCGFGCN